MTFDLSPLLRSSVGFDAFDKMFDNMFKHGDTATSYPPYNIIKSNNNYTITMAVAGFAEKDIDVSVEENELIISGEVPKQEDNLEFLHRGIAARNFRRTFRLAEAIKVGDASYKDGLLHIYLEREVPDHQKPRKIKIAS